MRTDEKELLLKEIKLLEKSDEMLRYSYKKCERRGYF